METNVGSDALTLEKTGQPRLEQPQLYQIGFPIYTLVHIYRPSVMRLWLKWSR
jgi:hypothetical protein